MSGELSWLDLFFGPATPRYADVDLPKEPVVEYVGDGVAVVDDPVNMRTVVTIGGGTGGLTAGRLVKDMADADQELSEEEAANPIVKLTGVLTVQRTLTFPLPASEAETYQRTVYCAVSDFDVDIVNGGADDVQMAPGDKAILVFSPDGVQIMATA